MTLSVKDKIRIFLKAKRGKAIEKKSIVSKLNLSKSSADKAMTSLKKKKIIDYTTSCFYHSISKKLIKKVYWAYVGGNT